VTGKNIVASDGNDAPGDCRALRLCSSRPKGSGFFVRSHQCGQMDDLPYTGLMEAEIPACQLRQVVVAKAGSDLT